MTHFSASENDSLPLAIFLGESQAGKSSLVNAVADVRLLPTTGNGAPRSQAVCEWSLPLSNVAPQVWKVATAWLPADRVKAIAAPEGKEPGLRTRLLHRGLDVDQDVQLAQLVSTRFAAGKGITLADFATGRPMDWMLIGKWCNPVQARKQLEILTADWPSAIAGVVTVQSQRSPEVCLVDLPGLGHRDVGAEATEEWLEQNSNRVAAIFCVVGKRTPDLLPRVLQRHWSAAQLQERLHIVATHADHQVADRSSEADRREVAQMRRYRAAEHLKAFAKSTTRASALKSRTFCIDPRREGRFIQRVDFDGELDRLRQLLATLRTVEQAPPRTPAKQTKSVKRQVGAEPDAKPVQGSPLSLLEGEDMHGWLSRQVLPELRKGAWQAEHLGSGRKRLHLHANNRCNRPVRLITIYGTGKAYFVASNRKQHLQAPDSDDSGQKLKHYLLEAAKRLEALR